MGPSRKQIKYFIQITPKSDIKHLFSESDSSFSSFNSNYLTNLIINRHYINPYI